ncbi:hypothetical protein Clacol_007946 [Clathrus columnatus]|uniref:Alpha/beta hydrolase fold-3 domain-containing protein n=1 Tax=Clathrus columnatus TaxID=1419009 RepID=A0AAV5AP49_9AGAM|nr:hypothetical protein Clacol_007946 [Clathrus columnatus]
MAQNAHLATPDPEWAAMSEHIPIGKPAVSVQVLREETEVLRARLLASADKGPTEGLKVIERSLEVENGEIRARVYIPDVQENEAGANGFPLMSWFYGGGFVLGSIDDDDGMLRNLAVSSRIVCVGADYRKAPENPFPTAVNDSYAAFKWALNNSFEFSVDVSKGVIVAGLSSGANLAAVIAQKSLKDPELKEKLTGQLLVMPTVISPGTYPEKFKSELLSLDKDEDQRILRKDKFILNSEAYRGSADTTNPELSPLLAESFEGLPPAYIQIAGLDILRDEGLLYARLLKEAGVATRVDTYPGLPHGFHVAFKHFDATKIQQADFVDGLNWLLGRTA